MSTLRVGSSGPEVRGLQQRLLDLGFDPDGIDGDFGPGTERAVMRFQRSQGLLVDGVAGVRTRKALGLVSDDALPSVLDQVTPDVVAEMFPDATPIANIRRYLPAVLDALREAQLHDRRMVLMALATIRAESESFAPISEFQSKYNTTPGGHPFDRYDTRRDLGNRGRPDGERFRGRGFIQLTGRANYARYGPRVGLRDELVRNPELANEPIFAARVLATFLKDKELVVKQALVARDFATARRAINGGSHGLDRFIDTYLTGERHIH